MSRNWFAIVRRSSSPAGLLGVSFANRAAWIRPLGATSYTDQINNMVRDISQMGVVETRPGPAGDPNFPSTIGVEELPEQVRLLLNAAPEEAHAAGEVDVSQIDKVRRFPRGLRR